MPGWLSLELLLILMPALLLVLLKLWRILSKALASNGGLDFGTTVDQLLASNIDSLLNRYTVILENRGAALLLVLEALRSEVLLLGEKLDQALPGLKPNKKDTNALSLNEGETLETHGSSMEDEDEWSLDDL